MTSREAWAACGLVATPFVSVRTLLAFTALLRTLRARPANATPAAGSFLQRAVMLALRRLASVNRTKVLRLPLSYRG
jgi:hypothetical protein